jgi:hypothetical protein
MACPYYLEARILTCDNRQTQPRPFEPHENKASEINPYKVLYTVCSRNSHVRNGFHRHGIGDIDELEGMGQIFHR